MQIKDIDENYQIYSDGRVYSKYKNGFLRPGIVKGYYRLGLMTSEGKKYYLVHRLVAQAFIPNPDNLETVNHINGIKTDNRIENLEWMNMRDNCVHYYKGINEFTGITKRKNGKYRSKINIGNTPINLGTYDTPEEGNERYLRAKELIENGETCIDIIRGYMLEEPKGYYYDKKLKYNPYQSHITYHSKKIHLGMFPTPEEAQSKYLRAKSLINNGETDIQKIRDC